MVVAYHIVHTCIYARRRTFPKGHERSGLSHLRIEKGSSFNLAILGVVAEVAGHASKDIETLVAIIELEIG